MAVKKVLVVEHDAMARLALSGQVRRTDSDLEVIEVRTAGEAFERCKTDLPDVIFLDFAGPRAAVAMQALHRIRGLRGGATVWVIAHVPQVRADIAELVEEHVVNDVLVGPPDDLTVLRRKLEGNSASGAAAA